MEYGSSHSEVEAHLSNVSLLFGIHLIPCKWHLVLKLLKNFVMRILSITKSVLHQTIHNYCITILQIAQNVVDPTTIALTIMCLD